MASGASPFLIRRMFSAMLITAERTRVIDPHFQGYAKPWFSVQAASVKTGVRLARRGHREAQPRPARGREAEVPGQGARHRFAGRTENPPEIVILPPAALPVPAGPSGCTKNGSFPYARQPYCD